MPGKLLFLHGQGASFGAETHLVTMLHLEMRNDVGERSVEVQTYVQASLNSEIVHVNQPAYHSWMCFGLLSRWSH